ncbi:MAG: HIT domain-containing protein [Acidobacteria bacterium]|nr:HIT domain-containing protein [Acidobacteriota bacterium]
MERLWSPWRLAYVSGSGSQPPGCIFCQAREATDHELVVFRGSAAYVILNLFPYNNGHLMIVPNRHVANLSDASAGELAELIEMTRSAEAALREAYKPDGLNVGINLGRSAGAGIVDHLHIHVVPRWAADTNFVTVVGDTRVLPEQLGTTRDRLRPIFERLAGERRQG